MFDKITAFLGNASGNFATTFAVCAIPLFGMAGAAIDYSSAMQTKSKIQAAADAAAIAAIAEHRRGGNGDLEELANQLFDANYSGAERPTLQIALADDNSRIEVRATTGVPTTFLNLVGHSAIPLDVTSVAGVDTSSLQIAMVLDVTGSMNSNRKLSLLKSAAQQFVDNILPLGNGRSDLVEFSVVPFNTTVRLDRSFANAPWLDLNDVSATAWEGCVWDRKASLDSTTTERRSGDRTTFYQASPWALVETGTCNTMPRIQRLTRNRTAISAAIRNLSASGRTNTNLGMVWGLNSLDDNAPFEDARPDMRKIIVMVTDGDNTHGRILAERGRVRDMDDATLETCSNAKAQGIELFTIRVVNGNRDMLAQCASDASHFFDVSQPNQLSGVFEAISDSIWSTAVALRQ